MSHPADTPPPASPYGPTDDLASTAAPPTSGDSPGVTRARRTLKRLAIALPLAGLALSIVALVIYTTNGGGGFGIDPLSEFAGLLLTFVGPTLLVLGLHMIVWRAMVRSLSRMTAASRVGMIIGVGGVLSFVSVILVIVLVFVGFMLLSLLLATTGQAM